MFFTIVSTQSSAENANQPMGSTTALTWFFVGLRYVEPFLKAEPSMLSVLHSALIIAIGWFAFSALDWVETIVKNIKKKFA
jgi:dolichyldiphosphatase